MKKMLFLTFVLCFPWFARAAVNTQSATIKVYKVYFSASGNCANPIVVLNGETTSAGFIQINMASNPTIGSGTITDGTYPCVIFKMSDQVTFAPSDSEGSCVDGTSYTIDVCKDYGFGNPPVTNAESGATSNCDSTENTIWVYMSTFSTTTTGAAANNPFTPPTSNGDSARGMQLSGTVTVSGGLAGTFVFGTNGKVIGTGLTCDMNPPDFAFRTSS